MAPFVSLLRSLPTMSSSQAHRSGFAPAAGGPMLARFVSTFRELGAFSELLRTNVEVTMVESLQQKWLKELLADAKDKTKRLDKRVAEYDSARLRHLGHKCALPRRPPWSGGRAYVG